MPLPGIQTSNITTQLVELPLQEQDLLQLHMIVVNNICFSFHYEE